MKKLVDQAAGEGFNGGSLLRGKRAETRVDAVELGLANLFCAALQRNDGGRGADRAAAFNKALDLKSDDGFSVDGFAAALFHVRGGHLLQIVDVIDEDAVEFVHLRIDVAGDGDVDEEHGPVAAAMEEGLAVFAAE